MAENPSTLLRIIVLLITVGCLSAKRFSIMAPNVFHVGVKEQVSITLFDSGNSVNVQLYLQDYPHRRKTFSRIQGRVDQGGNIFLPVKVEAGDLPDTASVDKQYVYLVAKSDDAHYQFHKEAKILLSYRDGMVFIQTDKPIYTPKQRVKFRVIPLEFDMKPSRRKITVVVQNPQGIRVQQWKDLDPSTGIISRILDLQDFVLLGNWTITATYGHRDIHNTSVQFEVKEYVLPKFSVKLTVPPYILNSDNLIRIGITTRYTFGKPVIGTATVYLSIVGRNGTIPFGRQIIMLDRSGVTTFRQRVQDIKQLPGIWFPEKGRLQVKVDVIERATGNKESAEDRSCQFTSSPYLIEYINTPKYFKPGLRYVVKVKVTYPNKQPARNVPMLISAKGKQGNVMIDLKRFDRDPNVRDNTDEHGEAEFVVDACSNCKAITVQVKTDDSRLNEAQNAVANYLAEPFDAAKGPLLMVRQLSPGKVGRKIHCESYRNLNNVAAKLSFAVVSRGRILSHNTTDLFDGIFKSWSFRVTSQMSPSARLIGYYIDSNGKVVADSILLKVEDSLPTEVTFPDAFVQVRGSRVQLNRIDKRPSEKYILKIEASEGTRLGLLSVDESVYLLRNDNRLTKEKIFKAAEELDMGCGVGGGKDSRDIFKKAGVVLMTNDFVSDGREDYGCAEDMSRKKRDVRGQLEDTICCDMAKDNGNVSCGKLSVDSNKGLSTRCRMSFWKCCMALYGAKDTALLGRSGLDAGNFEDYSDEKILDQAQKRSFFPETWIFDEKVVGSDGRFEMGFTMPDTITTWVMQAVAINNKTGLGLATPLNIVVFKEFFVSVKMPYSVKKGEQISLLATVYNYHNEEIRAKLYLRGDQDFCSIAQNRELSSIGNVRVPPRDARSVAVPIVPKRVGETEIEVSLIVQIKHGGSFRNAAGDIVIKKLFVVPEGKETQKSQTFILDPNGYLSDRPRSEDSKPDKPIKFPFESTRQYRPNDQLQVDNIQLSVPKAIIPGSVSAKIYLTGNLLGPIVNTTIQGGLESFIRMPGGCGEQTMRSFSPNVYVFEYLMNTKQVTGTMEANAYRFIQAGYQRVLTFRRADTSFSIWGEDRPGSVWLTAFVMKTFCKAQKFSGVNIDEHLVCSSLRWLIQNQGGAGFPALVYGRHLAGGVSGEGGVAMTAFVLAALGECKCPGVNSQTAINNAKAYLEVQYKTLNKPYSMALTAYALSLVNSVERFKANDRLVQNAVYDNVKKSRYWNAGGEALDIETAGYALMAQIILGRTGYAGPIVTYLTNKRRGGVGFSSSQDTFVALQALALYSERTAGNTLDLRVKLTSEIDAAWKPPEIHITPQNTLLRRQVDVKNFLGGKLFVETRGTGVAMLEVDVRYNVPAISPNDVCKFALKTTVTEIKDAGKKLFGPEQNDAKGNGDDKAKSKKKGRKSKNKGGKRKKGCKGKNKNKKKCEKKKPPPKHEPVKSIQLKVCTRYRERANTSMSIIDIGILTGFKPDQKSLKLLENVAEVDRHEVSDRSLVLYLSEIPNDRELCVNVQFDREYYVGVVQAVPINVYDYYEPDESCSVFYGPDKYSPLSLGVCDVGSSSCRCTQDVCTQPDPPIGNIRKLIDKACDKYHYVIKGRVELIDELNTQVEYVVKVLQVIKQGNKNVNVGGAMHLWRSSTCHSPDLKKYKEYLFMGLDNRNHYQLDKNSFVKLWPKRPANNKDKKVLEDFARQYASGAKCKN